MNLNNLFNEEKVRLDPACWHNKKIGNPKTKVKGGVRVNNCVPAESIEEAREIRNKKGRLLGTWDGREFTVDPDTQAWLIDELGPESAEQWVDNKTAELQKQSAPSEDQVKYYANELEKSDAQAGRPRQSRQQYYDLAVQMLSDQQGLAEEESEAAAQRKQYPSYYQHKDAGTIFRTQNDAGQTMNITPDDEEWDDYYRQQFPDMSTPNDEIPIRYNVDGTAVMVEGSAGKVVFSGQGADGGTYEIIQSGPTDFMIHANGKHIDTYGSLQRAMSVLKNEVPELQQGMTEDDDAVAAFMARGGEIQRLKPAKPRKGERWQGSAHIGAAGGRGTKGRVSGLAANTGKSGKPVVTAEQGNPVAGQDFTMKDGAQMKWNPASKSWQQQAPVPGDDGGFDVVRGYDTDHTIDNGNKSTGTYTSTTIAKNPTTGQQKSLASWDHTDPKTGKNYSGTNYIDPQGNAKVQKNYKESKKIKVDEVSLGDYGKKAPVSRAGAEIKKFFGRDDPAVVAAADRTIANRTKGLARADARRRPYTAPPVDKEKQRQQLTDKYPNIDQLVRRAEVNRDPNYEYADGQAYYDGQEAEQKYQRLKQIQRIIQGLNEETRQATVNTPVGDFTANITKDKSKNTVSGTMPVGGATLSATKDMTPGGAQSVSVDANVAPNLNLSATRKSADYNKGQLAGTKSVSATYTDTTGALGQPGQQHTATRTAGVGFGGASGPRVGKNYVTQIDKTLSDYMDEAKGINSIRNPNDLQPLEAGGGGGMGGGGGRTTSGPSPFGPKPGSREASVAQPNPNTMTVKQGPNPDYVPPKTLQQKYDELNKKLDQLPPAPPVKIERPGRAAADKRQTDQAQAAELKDVVPLSPAERDRLRPVDANKVRQSEINKEPPDLSNVRPGRDYKQPSNWDDVRPGLDEQSRKKQPPEEKYGPEYDDMVARVKKLAGLGPMRTVYDPAKRVYRNVPTAQQPKK